MTTAVKMLLLRNYEVKTGTLCFNARFYFHFIPFSLAVLLVTDASFLCGCHC